jgi:PIN domain nuclease of toxin-antitoxin system
VQLLLDTHALLWWLADAELTDDARRAIEDPANEVAVSAASVWEISIKRALGKLRTGDDLLGAIAASGFEPLAISLVHAEAAGALPRHHADPFDRMLVAQAREEGLVVVSRDRIFDRYAVPLLLC